MSEPRLFGVVVTYRRPHDLHRSLAALATQTRSLDVLTVVDNDREGDVRPTVRDVPHAAEEILVIDSPDNLGPAGGIALGMDTVLERADDADLVVILDDDDPLIDDRVLEDLFRVAIGRGERLGGVGLRGALLNRRTGRLRKPSPEAVDEAGFVAVDYLKSDWAPMYSVRAIRAVGTFETDLFFGFDDLEFGLRLNEAGYLLEAHRLGRPHPEPAPPPSASFRRSEWRTYYTLRNLLVILRRHASPSAVAVTVVVQGLAKPLVNLMKQRGPAWPQCRMAWAAVGHAFVGRRGRTVEPDAAKFSPAPHEV